MLLYWLLVIAGLLDMDSIGSFNLGGLPDMAGSSGGPMSIVISLWVFAAWLLIVPLTYFIIIPLTSPVVRTGLGLLLLALSLGLGLWLTRFMVRPLEPLFRDTSKRGGAHLLGKVCVISTARVDQKFGQANLDDKGAGLILQVRADVPNPLKRGDKALLVDYDAARGAYMVTAHWDDAP
jgi:hypothetical protein